jgi:hypothetical protein
LASLLGRAAQMLSAARAALSSPQLCALPHSAKFAPKLKAVKASTFYQASFLSFHFRDTRLRLMRGCETLGFAFTLSPRARLRLPPLPATGDSEHFNFIYYYFFSTQQAFPPAFILFTYMFPYFRADDAYFIGCRAESAWHYLTARKATISFTLPLLDDFIFEYRCSLIISRYFQYDAPGTTPYSLLLIDSIYARLLTNE